MPDPIPKEDESSLSSPPSKASIKHIDWDATVSFETNTIDALATHEIDISEGELSVWRNTRGLRIRSVKVGGITHVNESGEETWKLEEEDSDGATQHLGQRLVIDIPPTLETKKKGWFGKAPDRKSKVET